MPLLTRHPILILLFFKRSDTESCTDVLADLPALLLFLFGGYYIHNGHNYVGNIGGAVLCEAEHSIVGSRYEFRASHLQVILLIRSVQADENRVDQTFQAGGCLLLPNQIRQAIGIDADFDIALSLNILCNQ